MKLKRYVVAYDIPDNRRRGRVAACLSGYGSRMQKSVFEILIDPREMTECRERLQRLLDLTVDSLAVYTLCGACEDKRLYLGAATDPVEEERAYIV